MADGRMARRPPRDDAAGDAHPGADPRWSENRAGGSARTSSAHRRQYVPPSAPEPYATPEVPHAPTRELGWSPQHRPIDPREAEATRPDPRGAASVRPDAATTDAHGIPPVGRTRQPRSRRRDPEEFGYGRATPTADLPWPHAGHSYGPTSGDQTNPNGYRPFTGDQTNPNGYRPATAEPTMPNGYPPPRPPNFSGPDYGMPPPSGIPYGAPYGAPPGPSPSNGRPGDFRQPGAPYSPGRGQPDADRVRPDPDGTRPQGPGPNGPPPGPGYGPPPAAAAYAPPGGTAFARPSPRQEGPHREDPRRQPPPYHRPGIPAEPQPRLVRGRTPDDRATTPHETGRWSSSRGQWVPTEPRADRSDFAIERFEETTDLRRIEDRGRPSEVIDSADWTERPDQRPEWHPHTWDHAPTSRSTDWSESPLPQPPNRRVMDAEPERDPVASELMGERVPAGTVSAALAPLIWFGLAIIAYAAALFLFNDSTERAEAIDAGIKALPWLGVASTMSVGLALGFRWIGAGWKAGGLGFAAAVVSGTLTTILNSLIFG